MRMLLLFLAILYELLYERVFGVDQPMTASDEMINNKPAAPHNLKATANNSEKIVNRLVFIHFYDAKHFLKIMCSNF